MTGQEVVVFQPLDGFDDDVIALRAVGKLTADDYSSVLMPAISKAREGGRKIRLVLELGPEFDGYELGGMFADAKLGVADYNAFEKVAMITDADLIKHAVHLFAPLVPGQIRVFALSQIDDAKGWMAG